jgi:hypothetical protein
LAALIRPILAIDAQCIALECQSKAERLSRTIDNLLSKKMMNVERLEPVFAGIIAPNQSLVIDVLKVSFNGDAAYIEREPKLPKT